MSQKDAKRFRKLWRREIRAKVQEAAATVDTTMETLRRAIRPKPRLVPLFIWKRIVRIVIKDFRV